MFDTGSILTAVEPASATAAVLSGMWTRGQQPARAGQTPRAHRCR